MVVVLWQGVKEHCYFLKQIADAVKMRRAIGNAFERANIPGLTDQQRWVRQGGRYNDRSGTTVRAG